MNKKKLTLIIALIAVIIAGAYCTYNYFSKLRFEEKTIERSDENCEDDCFSVSLNYLHCKGNSEFAQNFNVVDSFDTHAKIPEHFAAVDAAAKKGGNVGVIAVGWDPGLFSLNRLFGESVLENGSSYTFWGKGVSQGHSDAIRRIKGVVDARQYTVPIDSALERVRAGENPNLTTREKHLRDCYVVVQDGADKARIEHEIKTMPNYFADYDTSVHFIDLETLKKEHGGIPHGGFVLRSGVSGEHGENKHLIEFSLKLDSNPEFTASVLVAYARAAYRLAQRGESGAFSVFDIAPALLSPKSADELRREIL